MNRQRALLKKRRKKKKKEKRDTQRQAKRRKVQLDILSSCGTCKACCYQFPVEEYEKKANEWCKHTCESGCAIHALKRAPVCEGYRCIWLLVNQRAPGTIPLKFRPDKSGIIGSPMENGVIQVSEYRSDALRTDVGNEFITSLAPNQILYHPPSKKIWHSGKKWTDDEMVSAIREAYLGQLALRAILADERT